MNEPPLEKRVEVLEAKITVIGAGLNTILTELAGIGEAEKAEQKKPTWNADSIKWVRANGARGPYERYPAEGEKPEITVNYRNMLSDLKGHGRKLTRDDFFYWIFTDRATVGRKRTKK